MIAESFIATHFITIDLLSQEPFLLPMPKKYNRLFLDLPLLSKTRQTPPMRRPSDFVSSAAKRLTSAFLMWWGRFSRTPSRHFLQASSLSRHCTTASTRFSCTPGHFFSTKNACRGYLCWFKLWSRRIYALS